MKNNTMTIQVLSLIILMVLLLGGYIWGFIQYNRSLTLEKALLKGDLESIGIIDEELISIREDKEITMGELVKSRERLDKLINAVQTDNRDTLSVEDALKIIEGLQ